jgi:hypothetical protein
MSRQSNRGRERVKRNEDWLIVAVFRALCSPGISEFLSSESNIERLQMTPANALILLLAGACLVARFTNFG